MERRAKQAAMPLLLAALCILLVSGAFQHASRMAWALLVLAVIGAVARWGLGHRLLRNAAECGLLCGIAALALAQLTAGLAYPLVYLVGAGYVLALPLSLALPLIGALLGLDAALLPLPAAWPVLLAHVSFTALFAALYHAPLGA